MKNEPFALIGVNSDSVETAKQAIEENGLNWRSFQNAVEGKSKISADWALEGWPTLVVLDSEMRNRYRGHIGDEAKKVVRELLAGMAKENE